MDLQKRFSSYLYLIQIFSINPFANEQAFKDTIKI